MGAHAQPREPARARGAVSTFDAERYAEAAARAVDLPLPEHCRPGVAANLARLAALAQSLLEFAIREESARETDA